MKESGILCRAFSPLDLGCLQTQGFALGWYMAAPLALNKATVSLRFANTDQP